MAASLAGCGGDSGGGNSGGGGGGGGGNGGGNTSATGAPWILGTTDREVTSLDPAGSYDLPSWTLQYNLFQTVLTIPAGSNTPEGDAAKSCQYDDPKTFTCTLQPNLKFSNGDDLTSSDVKFSIDRNVKMADPNGASGLFASLKSIDTPDDQTVTFNLSRPDTTFQFVLTTAAASIVDEDVFPADELLDDASVIGSGRFALSQYKPGEQAVLSANPEYTGGTPAKSSRVFIQYFKEPSALKLAIENGEVDVAWRSLSPTDVSDLKSNGDVKVLEGAGSEIRYFVWQLNNPVAKEIAIRRAVAQIIDRDAIAQRAYDGTVKPLYSIVPPGFPGQIDTFQTEFGDPDPNAARQLLTKAKIKAPVKLTLGYTPTHYGPNAVDEATELKRQLDASGLFQVTLKSAEWEQYQTLYKQGAYDLFQLGWFPDFLDADNYLSPFVVDGGFFENGYKNTKANALVAKEQGSEDQAVREKAFGQLQKIVATDVPLIPSWVGKNIAVEGPGMHGVMETLDPAFIFRLWTISKS